MIQFPIGKIAAIMLLVLFLIVLIFFVMRRWKKKKREEQLEKLKEEFGTEPQTDTQETSTQDKEILDETVEKILEAEHGEKNSIEIQLEEGYQIRLETQDLIALKTPQTILHKSFDSVRFEKVKETEDGVELFFQ